VCDTGHFLVDDPDRDSTDGGHQVGVIQVFTDELQVVGLGELEILRGRQAVL